MINDTHSCKSVARAVAVLMVILALIPCGAGSYTALCLQRQLPRHVLVWARCHCPVSNAPPPPAGWKSPSERASRYLGGSEEALGLKAPASAEVSERRHGPSTPCGHPAGAPRPAQLTDCRPRRQPSSAAALCQEPALPGTRERSPAPAAPRG